MVRQDMPRYVLAGTLAGAIVGIADATAAVLGPHRGTVTVSLFFYLIAGVILLPFGGLLGWGVYLVMPYLPTETQRRRMVFALKRPRSVLLLLVLLVAGLVSMTVIGYKRGIMVDAIGFGPLILGVVFGLFFWLGQRLLRPYPTQSMVGVCAAAFVFVAVLGITLSSVGKAGESASLLASETTLVRFAMNGLKRQFDNDGDGFAHRLCGEDCDCDDKDPTRNPGALDIPDNGIDEDCSGEDLTMAALEAVSKEASRPPLTSVKSPFKPPYNIILITIDTLRADRMHTYGYSRETTPNLDRFAKKSVLFEQVRSQGPSTRHVFPVLLTGRYFSTVALRKGKKWSTLLPENKTFAEHLKEAGYTTVAVLPYFRFKEHSGFQQGFDIWEPVLPGGRDATWEPTGDLVTDRGITHLRTLVNSPNPWLLWLHYFDPHASYVVHDDQPGFGGSKADRYDGEILFVDRQIQRFLDVFAKVGNSDTTAIVVSSDHGEGIGLDTDHGFTYHGFSLFDSETRVPLIVQVPGAAPKIEKECVGLIDVPPTLLALAGIPKPKAFHGVSLVPFLLPNPPHRGAFLMQLPDHEPSQAVMDWPYKLIWEMKTNRYGLYHLESDPNEQHNLIVEAPDIAKRMKNLLKLKLLELRQEGAGTALR